MYARQEQAWGYVPNYAKLFSHRPELMSLWAALLAGIRKNVDKRRFELVTLSAAHALRNSYCSLAHGRQLTEFFSAEQLEAIVDGGESDALSAAEIEMVRYARKVATDAASVSAADVSRLRGHGFSDAEIFDIAAIASARSFFAGVLDALGALPDAPLAQLPAALRECLTLGREVSSEPPEGLPESTESPSRGRFAARDGSAGARA
jgi:uncharacterized peroxidase-related enzyme